VATWPVNSESCPERAPLGGKGTFLGSLRENPKNICLMDRGLLRECRRETGRRRGGGNLAERKRRGQVTAMMEGVVGHFKTSGLGFGGGVVGREFYNVSRALEKRAREGNALTSDKVD